MKFTHIFYDKRSDSIMAEDFDKGVAPYQMHRYCHDVTRNFNESDRTRQSIGVLLGHHAGLFNTGSNGDKTKVIRHHYVPAPGNFEGEYPTCHELQSKIVTQKVAQ